MTILCRLSLLADGSAPAVDVHIVYGEAVVTVDDSVKISRSHDICQFTACSARVVQGIKYCQPHAEYARANQKVNYAQRKARNELEDVCMRQGCNKPRAMSLKRQDLKASIVPRPYAAANRAQAKQRRELTQRPTGTSRSFLISKNTTSCFWLV